MPLCFIFMYVIHYLSVAIYEIISFPWITTFPVRPELVFSSEFVNYRCIYMYNSANLLRDWRLHIFCDVYILHLASYSWWGRLLAQSDVWVDISCWKQWRKKCPINVFICIYLSCNRTFPYFSLMFLTEGFLVAPPLPSYLLV